MAITQSLCTSFKQQLLAGEQNFGVGTTKVYKIALYTSDATLDANTTTYSGTAHEVVGAGYTAGGNVLTVSTTPTTSGTTAFVSFNNVTWAASTITASGALIYNATDDTAVAVLNFGANKSSNGSDFTVDFPPATATTAIIRVE